MRAKHHRARWTPDEVADLKLAWSQGRSLKGICEHLGRTATSVLSKLGTMRELYIDTETYAYHFRNGVVYVQRYEVARIDKYMRAVDPNAPWPEFFGVAT